MGIGFGGWFTCKTGFRGDGGKLPRDRVLEAPCELIDQVIDCPPPHLRLPRTASHAVLMKFRLFIQRHSLVVFYYWRSQRYAGSGFDAGTPRRVFM